MTGEKITVLKCNLAGDVTWRYEGRVIKREKKEIVLEAFFNHPDLPFMNVVFRKGDRFVEAFYTDRWYNIFEIFDHDDGQRKGWYCNICMPAIIKDQTVSYIDLALDLWIAADGRQTLLDEVEFRRLNLDDQTARHAWRAVRGLKEQFRRKHPRTA